MSLTHEQAKPSPGASTVIPLPPSATIETSSEPPRTLWMGDLDPSFDEATIQQIWQQLDQRVFVKLIRAKKNLLIPCSSTAGSQQQPQQQSPQQQQSPPQQSPPQESPASDEEAAVLDGAQKININGVSFIDPATTPLHHAGYCFVEFVTQQDAQYALSLNSTSLPNFVSKSTGLATNPTGQRNFRLNWASGATLQSSIPSRPEFSLFVGDLSPTATEADLLSLFQQKFRSVKTVRVMTDPITGASRCFGFVRFGNEEERRRALVEMNGVWCQGRCLRVAYATPRNNMMWQVQAQVQQQQSQQQQSQQQQSQQQQSQQQQSQNSQTPLLVKTANTMMGSAGAAAGTGAGANMMSHQFSSQAGVAAPPPDFSSAQAYTTDPNNTTVFIGGLTPKINEPQLQALFSPFGNILTVKIPQGKNCGFVKFESRIDAEAAIQGMQGFVVGGNPIRLSWGRNTVSPGPAGGASGASGANPMVSGQNQFVSQQQSPYGYVPMSHSASSVSSQPLEMYQKSMLQAAQAQAQAQAQAHAQAHSQAQPPMWWGGGSQWGSGAFSNGIYGAAADQQQMMPLMYQQLAQSQMQSQPNTGQYTLANDSPNSSGVSLPDGPMHPSVLR